MGGKGQDSLLANARSRISLLVLVVAFMTSRVFYLFYLNVRFDASPLDYFVQFADPQLLKDDLIRSIFYMHSQPPLFNLFLGLVLKLFPETYALVFHLVYLTLGLLFAISLLLVLEKLGVATPLNLILASIFMVAPATVLYENWLFYTYPVAALLCFSALVLHKFVSERRLRYGAIFFATLAVIALTRGIFGIAWFAVFALMLLRFMKLSRKKVICACTVPLLLICFVSFKDQYVFGHSTGYAYLGPNIAEKLTRYVRPSLRDALIQDGKVSRLLFEPTFVPISQYRELGEIPKTGIAILDLEMKSTGHKNFHHIGYVEVSTMYLKDSVYLLFNHPELYLQSLKGAFTRGYFLPSSASIQYNPGYEHVRGLDRYFNAIFLGQRKPGGNGVFLLIGFPLLMVYGSSRVYKIWRGAPTATELPYMVTLLFMLLNVLYVTAITTLISFDDFSRYRFDIDAFYVTILGLLLADVLQRIKWVGRQRRNRRHGPEDVRPLPDVR